MELAGSMTGTAAEEAIAEAGGPGPAYQGGQQVRIWCSTWFSFWFCFGISEEEAQSLESGHVFQQALS